MNKKEINYRNRQKLPVAKHDLDIEHIITEDDVELKMLDSEKGIDDIGLLIGKKLKNKVHQDNSFREKDF